MSSNGRPAPIGRILPNRMAAAFPHMAASMPEQVPDKVAPLHAIAPLGTTATWEAAVSKR